MAFQYFKCLLAKSLTVTAHGVSKSNYLRGWSNFIKYFSVNISDFTSYQPSCLPYFTKEVSEQHRDNHNLKLFQSASVKLTQ